MPIRYATPDPVNVRHGEQLARRHGVSFTAVGRLPAFPLFGEALIVDFDQLRAPFWRLAVAPQLLFLHTYDEDDIRVRLGRFGHDVRRTLAESIDAAVAALYAEARPLGMNIPRFFGGGFGNLGGVARL